MKILIRADAGINIGTGHVMRCLALAQAAQTLGHEVRLVSRITVDWLKFRLGCEKVTLRFLPDHIPQKEIPSVLIAQIEKDIGEGYHHIILDGYHFGTDCQQAVRKKGCHLLVIDDCGCWPEYSCDILLNQNAIAKDISYKGDIGRELLGVSYTLLRQEFIKARQNLTPVANMTEKVENLLISFGGGNFLPYLAPIAADLCQLNLKGVNLRIIIGSMPVFEIQKLFHGCSATIELLSRVDNMANILSQTDLCISAGGSTCWELCCLGIPFLCIAVAENQKAGVSFFEKQKLAPSYTEQQFYTYFTDSNLRRRVSSRLRSILDANGANRVVKALANVEL